MSGPMRRGVRYPLSERAREYYRHDLARAGASATPAKKPTKQAAKKPTKQAAKTQKPARSAPKRKPVKKAEREPTLRQQMVIAILRAELGDSFSADDIGGKTKLVGGDRWKTECRAPLGN